MIAKKLVLALTIVIAAALQLKLKPILGWSPDILLTALVAASFYSALPGLIFLTLLGMWFLNWQPGFGVEMLFYAALPIAALFLRRLFPWQPWFVNLILGASGITFFYAGSAGYATVIAEMPLLLENILWSSLFGLTAFKIYDIASR